MSDVPSDIKVQLALLVDTITDFELAQMGPKEEVFAPTTNESVVGDALDLVEHLKKRLTILACEHELDPTSIQHFTHAIYRMNCKLCGTQGEILIGSDKVTW